MDNLAFACFSFPRPTSNPSDKEATTGRAEAVWPTVNVGKVVSTRAKGARRLSMMSLPVAT